jgi:hypothetical protein
MAERVVPEETMGVVNLDSHSAPELAQRG